MKSSLTQLIFWHYIKLKISKLCSKCTEYMMLLKYITKPLILTITLSVLTFNSHAELLFSPAISATVEQQLYNNPDQSPVVVSGMVKKIQTNNLTVAANVTVRFWQPSSPGAYVSATTDIHGEYKIGLTQGLWKGEACGSGNSFSPAAWEVLIEDKKIKRLQELNLKNIRLDILTPSNLVQQHSAVTLTGEGFGCNGALVFTYSNSVDRCDKAQPVDYSKEQIIVSDFISRNNNQLQFDMPELDAQNRSVTKHVASVQYVQGANRSDGIAIGETILASQAGNDVLCNNAPVGVATSGAVSAAASAGTHAGTFGGVTMEAVVASGSVTSGVVGDATVGGGNNPQLMGSDFSVEAFENIDLDIQGIINTNRMNNGSF